MSVLLILLFLILGAMAGTAHFTLVRRDATLLVHGGNVVFAIALRLARLLLTTALLVVAARQGWSLLLAAAAGILLARQLVVSAMRQAI